jgi:NAD(P)-dependent dehydrogenase (short-subunit alcohol dehydrogenase family)
MKILENKVAIITGGCSGIGRATAILLASEGAKIVIADMDEAGAKETIALITASKGESIFVKTNTSIASDSKNVVDQTIEKYGRLDIAFNNAGIGGLTLPVADYPIEEWDKVIGINLSGVFYGMHYQIPAMLKSGGGSIVNMSSILGSVGTKNLSAYVAAKHGVIGLTKAGALENADKKIRINAVGPGYISTPLLTKTLDTKTIGSLATLHPIGRLGTAEEVAELILWLSSSRSSFVTGSYYTIDGGYTAQ